MKIKELVKSTHRQFVVSVEAAAAALPSHRFTSPFCQVEGGRIQLPPLYTVSLERLKFAKLQLEIKERAALLQTQKPPSRAVQSPVRTSQEPSQRADKKPHFQAVYIREGPTSHDSF